MLTELARFADNFRDVMQRVDIPAMAAFHYFPMLLTTQQGSVVLQSAADLEETATKIHAYYSKSGPIRFDPEPLELVQLTPTAALLRAHMRTLDASGMIQAEGHYTYILRHFADGYKIISVLSDGPVMQRLADEYPHDSWKN